MPQPVVEPELTCLQCSTKNPPYAKSCFQCGRLFPSAAPHVTQTSAGLSRLQKTILVIAISALVIVFLVYGGRNQQHGFNGSRTVSTRALTAEHRNAIHASLQANGYPTPDSLELTDSGFLVATFELRGRVSPQSLKRTAEGSLIVIREAMLPFKIVEAYRVTLNGPSPGTGLIRRYGNGRFIEGGSFEWEPAE